MSTAAERSAGRALKAAEDGGLKIALKVHMVAAVLIAAWIGFTYPADVMPAALGAALAVLVVGAACHQAIGTRFDRSWFRHGVFAVDAVALVAFVVFGPLSYVGDGTVSLIIGAYGSLIVLLLIPLAAVSLSPRLVIWTGLATLVAWWGAFLIVIADLNWTPSLGSLPLMPSAVMLATAGLLALGLTRARAIVIERAVAAEARTHIGALFGRYVPASVVDDLAGNPAALTPAVRDATVMFVDIANFTTVSEDRSPADTLAILDAFVRRAGKVVAEGGGVIVGVRGDAFVAAFNLPLEVNDYPDRAVWVARALLRIVRKETFAGAELALGIGIATGPVTAGAVGSTRPVFAIHGDTVSRAERLQAMNEELQSRILLDADTASGLSEETDLQKIGAVELRGREASVAIFGV